MATITPETVAAAIKATEYKYFGDYEMSDDQREAVDVLVEVARKFFAPPAMDREAVEEALAKCVEFIEEFKENGAIMLAEGVHAGLRKGSDAADSMDLWKAISNSETTAWMDAAIFAHDPFFSMWGGDEALNKARHALSTLSADAIRQGEGMRALSDRATPGPWSWEQCGEQEDVPVVGIAFPNDDPDCKAPYEGEFRDSDANRMTIAFDWQSCDGHSPSANAAFAVAAVNFVRKLLATPGSHASDGGKA